MLICGMPKATNPIEHRLRLEMTRTLPLEILFNFANGGHLREPSTREPPPPPEGC